MNTLLGVANCFLQYHRGKQTGLVGLIGIAVAIFIASQWEHILPVLDSTGIVSFFKEAGLVYEGEAGLTGFAIFMFILQLCILFVLVVFILLVAAILISMIFSSEIGFKIVFPIIALIITPITLVWIIIDRILHWQRYRQESEQKKLAIQQNPLEQLLNEYSEEIPREQALMRLNRIPTNGDDSFLLGITADKKLYMLLPRPINFQTAKHKAGDLEGVHYSVEKYIESKHKPKSMFERVPKLFHINPVNSDLSFREVISSRQITAFYQTKNEDMLYDIKGFSKHHLYKKYVEETLNEYFTTKETILNNISNTTDERTFNDLVQRLSMFDAINEDIVKMMKDSERQMRA